MAGGKYAQAIMREAGMVPGFVGSDEDHDAYRERAVAEKEAADAVEADATTTTVGQV